MPRRAEDRAAVREVVALLAAAFPWTNLDPHTVDAYSMMLADLPTGEVRDAAAVLGRIRDRFPTVNEIRSTVIERRLGLPEPIEAWEWVAAAATTPLRHEDCRDCRGTGLLDPARDAPCPACGGRAEVEVARSPLVRSMPEPLSRAYRAVGGADAIGGSIRPEIVRAQFLKAYEATRRRELERLSLGSAGLAVDRARPPQLPRGDAT